MQRQLIRMVTKGLSICMNSMGSIPRLRAFTEKISRPLRLPKGVTLQRQTLNGIPVEWIVPAGEASQGVIFYLHGGAWVLGWQQTHRLLAAHLAKACGCRVVAVDYRLAPEHPFPAPLNDCLAAFRGLLNQGISSRQVVVAGDSAGANLGLATLISLRDASESQPAAAVCISPMTDLACTGGTFNTCRDALLNPVFARTMAGHYAENQDARQPLISPHYADLKGLPPLLIQAGEDEILLSDAQRLDLKARQAGVDVTLTVWPKMWHVWHVCVPFLAEAVQAVEEIGRFVHGCLGRWGGEENENR